MNILEKKNWPRYNGTASNLLQYASYGFFCGSETVLHDHREHWIGKECLIMLKNWRKINNRTGEIGLVHTHTHAPPPSLMMPWTPSQYKDRLSGSGHSKHWLVSKLKICASTHRFSKTTLGWYLITQTVRTGKDYDSWLGLVHMGCFRDDSKRTMNAVNRPWMQRVPIDVEFF